MRRLFVSIAFLSALSLIASNVAVTQTASGTLGGVVKDPTGAVIAGAQVSIRNEATGETRNATTDDEGRFKIEGLAPGRYTLSVSQTGFKDASRNVQIEAGRGAKIEIQLEVAAPRAEIDVGAKGGIAPNMDPNYRGLREGEIFESYEVKDLVVKRDAGTFTFRSGR
ncbi:MAG: carboxypeptidase-like regulatory domain-containing protein, partial [Blastocatellia bacterium]|nr:carboxypeptidase-like regulatory domain-containing protein [Blastocatellia bacterium]